jgi:hypothetical protein
MKKIELLPANETLDEFILSRINTFPEGMLYNFRENSNLFKLAKALFSHFRVNYLLLEEIINSINKIDVNNYYLEEYKQMKGLPNVIFPDLKTKEDSVFAINMMSLANELFSRKDFEDFLFLLGYNVKIYKMPPIGFDYEFPFTFSNSISKKDKLTFFVYVEEIDQAIESFNNLGDAFPIEFVNISDRTAKVKIILDYIKPCYITFIYINLQTKNLYNL